MIRVRSMKQWHGIHSEIRATSPTLGLVPTMGALHKGHASLIERSVAENDVTVVSIFVNAPQFNDPKDLAAYPTTLEDDEKLLRALRVNYVFVPRHQDVYPDDYRYRVDEMTVSRTLCGAHRPGHFTGVLTVVMRLLNIIRPDRTYFGEKDYQQYVLVRDMVQTFFLPVDIVPCPIVRDTDGVALSSRNTRLTLEGRKRAAMFAEILCSGQDALTVQAELQSNGITVDYVEDMFNRRLAAVVIDGVRLIDNVPLSRDTLNE